MPRLCEQVPIPKANNIHGHGTVELFDDRTGKLKHRQQFENFIALPAQLVARHQLRSVMNDGLSNLTAHDDQVPPSVFTHLFLTNDASVEDPATERYMKGGVVGWSNKTPYVGADAFRGTPNAVGCAASDTFVRWVFDWPTHAANGTFQSINWGNALNDHLTYFIDSNQGGGYTWSPLAGRSPALTIPGYTRSGLSGGPDDSAGLTVTYTSTTGPDRIVRYDPDDWSVIQSLDVVDENNSYTYPSAVFDGTDYWAIRNGTSNKYIARIDGTTGVATAITSNDLIFVGGDARAGLANISPTELVAYWGTTAAGGNGGLTKRSKLDGSVIGSGEWTMSGHTFKGGSSGYPHVTYDYDDDIVWVLASGNGFPMVPFDRDGNDKRLEYGTFLVSIANIQKPGVGFSWQDNHKNFAYCRGRFWKMESTGHIWPVDRHQLGARTRLVEPVTKTSSHAMKITYQYDFV